MVRPNRSRTVDIIQSSSEWSKPGTVDTFQSSPQRKRYRKVQQLLTPLVPLLHVKEKVTSRRTITKPVGVTSSPITNLKATSSKAPLFVAKNGVLDQSQWPNLNGAPSNNTKGGLRISDVEQIIALFSNLNFEHISLSRMDESSRLRIIDYLTHLTTSNFDFIDILIIKAGNNDAYNHPMTSVTSMLFDTLYRRVVKPHENQPSRPLFSEVLHANRQRTPGYHHAGNGQLVKSVEVNIKPPSNDLLVNRQKSCSNLTVTCGTSKINKPKDDKYSSGCYLQTCRTPPPRMSNNV
jgi:hypothetical protein